MDICKRDSLRALTGWAACAAGFAGAQPLASSTTPPTRTPAAARTGADAIASATGAIDAASYRAMAGRMGTAEAIAYRYGDAASSGTTDLPLWWEPPARAVPTDRERPRGGRPVDPRYAGTYQVGTWSEEAGEFSSNWGHVAFIADDPGQRLGVMDLLLTSISNATLSERPELPWMYYGRGLDAVGLVEARAKDGVRFTAPPVAIARCHGRPGWGVTSVVAFADGLIANTGSNTQTNRAHCRLPPDLVPTGVALTNSNEFALVTCWNPRRVEGAVAVIALCALPDGDTTDRLSGSDNWGEWTEPHPGLPNLGNFAFMKFLGTVPLPGMAAPTELSATTGMDRYAGYLSAGGPDNDSPHNIPLSNEANRAKFFPGGLLRRAVPQQGWAVVVSKSERKALWLDLRPLFQFYASMYFGSRANYERTRNLGQGAGQWPPTFQELPGQRPVVTRTAALEARPTAVKCYAWGALRQAWVATEPGQLLRFGIADAAPGGMVQVGRNPTAIELAKEKALNVERLYPDFSRELLVTSRAERAVQWVRLDGREGRVVRELRDRRLKDPITACDTDNQGSELYVVTVVDYAGRAVRNYRFGALHLAAGYRAPRYGMGPDGQAAFEYGGAFEVPGRPFALCSSNTS